MAQLDDRLARCFSSVFPGLTDEEIRGADVARLAEIDSLAGVTLVSLIGEEVGVDVDFENLVELGSFQGVQNYLRQQGL